ncbi:MAG: serine hydrolase [Acidimicrobiia bacterium]
MLGPAIGRLLPPGIVGDQHGRHRAFRPFYVEGASYGGLVGDVLDASRLASLHLGDGTFQGRTVMSASAARRMREISAPGKPFDLGQGWFRSPEHRTGASNYVEHLGAGGGFFNVMRIYPDHGIGIVVMSNSTSRFPHHDLLDALLQVASAH